MLKMSGRIYNAMMKFAGGTKSFPQFANMFFDNGKIYATDSCVMCRWTPANEYEVLNNAAGEKIEHFFFTPRMSKISAGTTIYIDDIALDIDCESKAIESANLDKIMDDTYKHPIDIVLGVNPDYLAAIAAYEGELGIIPLNMRDGSLIVRGRGNENWLFSLPHGAGRILSRGEARRTLDLADYEKSMEGIYTTSVCSSTIDEAPDAYKPAELIEQAIGDNAEIIEHIYPIYNFKAKG